MSSNLLKTMWQDSTSSSTSGGLLNELYYRVNSRNRKLFELHSQTVINVRSEMFY